MTELETHVHESIDSVNENQWDNVVQQSGRGTVFHRAGWLRAVETGLDRDVCHVVVSKGGNPIAILPNVVDDIELGSLNSSIEAAVDRLSVHRLVSAEPGYGGPLILTDTAECLDELFGTLDEWVNGSTVYHTIKSSEPDHLRYGKYMAKLGFSPSLLSCRFVVDLDRDWDRIEEEMDKTRRHALRKARESGVEVDARSIDEVDLGATYRAYERNMDRIDGTVFPRSFFRALRDHAPDRTLVFTATADGDVVGRYVNMLDDEQSTVRYFLSAIGDEDHFEYNVSEMLHARAMQWGMDHGYETYDFGATGAEFSDGLFRYKEKYGGEIRPILQWQRGTSPVAWPVYKLGRQLYQKVTY